MKKIIFFFLLLGNCLCFSQNRTDAPSISRKFFTYKKIEGCALFLETIYPPEFNAVKTYPAIIFFFGGGWKTGNRSQFREQAKYFAKRGAVCFLADYRTESNFGTTPFEAVEDAKSAMRFIRSHANDFHIAKNKIVACGGSAGGQLAAATALIESYDALNDDLKVSPIPDALILFNPVLDNGPGGYGYNRVGDAYKNFSPLHNIHKGAPQL